jgi:hypothetical protein
MRWATARSSTVSSVSTLKHLLFRRNLCQSKLHVNSEDTRLEGKSKTKESRICTSTGRFMIPYHPIYW